MDRSQLMCVLFGLNLIKLFEVGVGIKAIEIVSHHLVTENVLMLKEV